MSLRAVSKSTALLPVEIAEPPLLLRQPDQPVRIVPNFALARTPGFPLVKMAIG